MTPYIVVAYLCVRVVAPEPCLPECSPCYQSGDLWICESDVACVMPHMNQACSDEPIPEYEWRTRIEEPLPVCNASWSPNDCDADKYRRQPYTENGWRCQPVHEIEVFK